MNAPLPDLPSDLAVLLPSGLHVLCEPVRHARGSCLFSAGARPTHMFHVRSGEVTLQRVGVDGDLIILQRSRGGFIGEASLLAERYHCDAVALVDTASIRIPIRPLLDALRTDAAFAFRWIETLNRELRRLRLQSERLSLKTVEARLLHLLETDAGPDGLPIASGVKTLARELGVSHEALYRCLSRLEDRGTVRRADGVLRLVGGAQAACPR